MRIRNTRQKKTLFNKAAKRKTGGGPYEEKFITNVEEQIIEASGLEVAVEGLQNVMNHSLHLDKFRGFKYNIARA